MADSGAKQKREGMMFTKGQRVVYVPTHAERDRNHPDCENGVVKCVSGATVFVLYDCAAVPHMTAGDEPYTAQGTNEQDLVLE
jgi:hypothetical protein